MVRYEDVIRKFPHCPYHVNTSLDFLFTQLGHWGEKPLTMELNPDFQRGHVWTEKQQIAFVEFLLKDPQDSKAKSIIFNCRNWTAEYKEKNADVVYLVDGLQRLTAIRRFMNNEIPVNGYYLNEFESSTFLKRIYLDIYVNSLNRAEMLKWYVDLNSGGTVHSEEEIARVRELAEKELLG